MEKLDFRAFEIEFIDLYGRSFEKTGRTSNMGKIFGLLILKNEDENFEGMDQEEIVAYFDKTDQPMSMSTVSRNLKKMEQVGYVTYTMELIGERARRKYLIKSNIKEMALDRIKVGMYESQNFISKLEELQSRVDDNDPQSQSILDRIQVFVVMYSKIINVYQDVLERADELLKF